MIVLTVKQATAGVVGATLLVALGACSSESTTPSPTMASSSSSAAPAGPSQSATPTAGKNDPMGLVEAMWQALDPSSQSQLCDIYAQQGDKAALIFVAGTQTDPKADILSDNDKASIASAGAGLLKAKCG